jgi:hypothetical protein
MLSEQEFRAMLDRYLTTPREGTYEEWRKAMRLLVAHASREQWGEVLPRLRQGLRGVVSRQAARQERTRATPERGGR